MQEAFNDVCAFPRQTLFRDTAPEADVGNAVGLYAGSPGERSATAPATEITDVGSLRCRRVKADHNLGQIAKGRSFVA